MRRLRHVLSALGFAILCWSPAGGAHFLELIPDTDLVTRDTANPLALAITFTHPMSGGPAMPMEAPVRFGVVGPGGRQDLRAALQPVQVDGERAYRADFRVRRPGDYAFFVEPPPYWEPAEGRLIVHYPKVVVNAYGGGGDWQEPLGLPVEIVPLTRPYGLWTGNVFRGVVIRDGRPVPHAEVEVEWRNDGSVESPADAYLTQVVRADDQGVFAYGIPRAGWWGFAALLEAAEPALAPSGESVPVELGALIWVHARDMSGAGR